MKAPPLLLSLYLALASSTAALSQAPANVEALVVNVRELGAKGDGITNDTAAFREASAKIEAAGGGVLTIPPGLYIVGEQEASEVPGERYYRSKKMVSISHANGVVIEGNGATLRLADGLRYGSFNEKGEPINPEGHFTHRQQAAAIGTMIEVRDSRNVRIRNLTLDGNNFGLVLGGKWGDKGRQLVANGVGVYNCRDVLVENIRAHHHGLDGIYISVNPMGEDDEATPHVLENVVSEYNARQGLSWVGGKGLVVRNSRFNHTGRGAFSSAPAAGVDIEPNRGAVCRDGLFENCEFINNVGVGVLADAGDGGYTRFVNCLIWGTTSYSTWIRKPGITFEGCTIYGTVVHGYGHENPELATRYLRCHFEDPTDREYPAYRRFGALVTCDVQNGENITFDGCTFYARQVMALILRRGNGKVLRNSTVVHAGAPERGRALSRLWGTRIENTRFLEADTLPGGKYIIDTNARTSVGPEVFVDGLHSHWAGKHQGEIIPTP